MRDGFRLIIGAITAIGALIIAHCRQRADRGWRTDGRPVIFLLDALSGSSRNTDAPIDARFLTEAHTPVDLGSLQLRIFIGWIRRYRLSAVTSASAVWRLEHPSQRGALWSCGHLVRLWLSDLKERAVEAIPTVRIADDARRM
jgi:hypothetical protein